MCVLNNIRKRRKFASLKQHIERISHWGAHTNTHTSSSHSNLQVYINILLLRWIEECTTHSTRDVSMLLYLFQGPIVVDELFILLFYLFASSLLHFLQLPVDYAIHVARQRGRGDKAMIAIQILCCTQTMFNLHDWFK